MSVKTTISVNIWSAPKGLTSPAAISQAADAAYKYALIASQVCQTLEHDGWIGRYFGSYVYFQHPEVACESAAVARLLGAGVDLALVGISSHWQDWSGEPKTVIQVPDDHIHASGVSEKGRKLYSMYEKRFGVKR